MKILIQGGPRAGQEVSVEPGQTVVFGRDPDAGVSVDDDRVSRRHAQLRVDSSGDAVLEDLGSTNGTFVNGKRISAPTPVHDGDSVGIGNSRFAVAGAGGRGAKTVVADSGRRSTSGLTVMRASIARANRTSQLAIAVAAIVVAVVLVAGAAWFVAGRPLSNDDIVTRMKPSVVRIEARSAGGGGSGTGWVLDAARGLIVTNNHVISGNRDFTVTGEGVTPRTANLIAASPCDDVAVLHVDDKAGLTTSQLATQGALHQGDDVLALGYPGTGSAERNLVVTTGTVSVVKTTFDSAGKSPDLTNLPNVLLTTAKVNPGNSGGPLVTRSAQVVGINSISNLSLDQNYAIGIDRVKEISSTLADGHGLGWTGMGFEWKVTPSDLGFGNAAGLLVLRVEPGTEAADAGFGQFPILITAIDDHAVTDMPSYCSAVGGKPSGSSGKFAIAAVNTAKQVVRATITLHFR